MTSHDWNHILEEVGDAPSPPPLPPNGIPRQWLPGWIRWPLKLLFLPLVLLDLQMQKLAAKIIKPPFVQKGNCKKRGNCCHYIMIEQGKGLFGWLYLVWHTQVNGFFPRSKELFLYEEKKVLVMGCRYLQKDGSCGHYRSRPLVCRKWPVIEQFGSPKMLKGCGFYAAPRDKS